VSWRITPLSTRACPPHGSWIPRTGPTPRSPLLLVTLRPRHVSLHAPSSHLNHKGLRRLTIQMMINTGRQSAHRHSALYSRMRMRWSGQPYMFIQKLYTRYLYTKPFYTKVCMDGAEHICITGSPTRRYVSRSRQDICRTARSTRR
jgi:hypothetical protein